MYGDTLTKRLMYHGGRQDSRMIVDKIKSLRKALLYSYQKGTAVLEDGREFLALFNPNNLKPDYDTKMLSIPYADVCLNKEKDIHEKTINGIEPTDIKAGDVIEWKETNTHWLVYLRYLEEIAYFRSDIRRCDQYVEVNGHKYWVYIRGPVETSIVTGQKQGLSWNDLNYSLVMYITRNKETDDFFHRHQLLKVGNVENDWQDGEHWKTWKVVNANPYYGDGIIEVFLDEYYENTIAEMREEELREEAEEQQPEPENVPLIDGAAAVDIYSSNSYTIVNLENPNGVWKVDNENKAFITKQTPTTVNIRVISGKSGKITLTYTDNNIVIEKIITINSF